MKLKSVLYKKEQDEIMDKIINILDLDDENSIILYHLDNDEEKQNKILKLIPEIRKYYSFSTIIGASEPSKAKRPYLSIVRQITKSILIRVLFIDPTYEFGICVLIIKLIHFYNYLKV